jgi:hypothetical protein
MPHPKSAAAMGRVLKRARKDNSDNNRYAQEHKQHCSDDKVSLCTPVSSLRFSLSPIHRTEVHFMYK